MDTGFLTSVQQSGLVGQIIIVALFAVSVYSWAVIFYKGASLKRALRRSEEFLARFREDPDAMISHYADRQRFTPSPFASVFEGGLDELALLMRRGRAEAGRTLTMAEIDSVERSLERAIAEEVIELRRNLIALATTAGGAPFVGLFGTVWGIMKAFAAMSVTGSASISSVAPGVSAALTTTVAGLAVAIPALVGYNYLMNRVRHLTIRMENFSSEFLSVVERNFGSS
ncbi:MAG: Tol-Pal system subunit TolQ [Candidatus Eisenbacteria bacterium]|nr:Tol-Pal system subunit TolQ [Candidatus Eisenbacteria bacterium]